MKHLKNYLTQTAKIYGTKAAKKVVTFLYEDGLITFGEANFLKVTIDNIHN